MNRAIFTVFAVLVMFGLYRCATIKPEDTKYHAILTTEINRIYQEESPLCQGISLVKGFPHVAPLKYNAYVNGALVHASDPAVEPVPDDPLSVKWRDLVAAGLLRESQQLDLDLNLVGFNYELTELGRELYAPRTLASGETGGARFCIGKASLKQIIAISKPVYSIEGLNVTAKYIIKVDPAPHLYDDVAKALDIKVPTRAPSGEILYPEATSTFVFNRDTGKLVNWMQMN